LFKQNKYAVFCSLCGIIIDVVERVSFFWPTWYKAKKILLCFRLLSVPVKIPPQQFIAPLKSVGAGMCLLSKFYWYGTVCIRSVTLQYLYCGSHGYYSVSHFVFMSCWNGVKRNKTLPPSLYICARLQRETQDIL